MPERETAAEYLAALFSGERDTHAAGYLWPSQRYEDVGGIPLFKGLLFADDALWFKLMQGTYKAMAAEDVSRFVLMPTAPATRRIGNHGCWVWKNICLF
jgi:hypothetical protein